MNQISPYQNVLNAERESTSTLEQTQIDSSIADSGMVLQNDQEVNEQNVLDAKRDKTGLGSISTLGKTGLGSMSTLQNDQEVNEQNIFRFTDKEENESQTPN